MKEIEIKFKIGKKDKIEEKFLGLKAKRLSNFRQVIYGFFSENSIEEGIFPRIRNEADGKWYLTIKVKPTKETKYFERTEWETRVDDPFQGIKMLKLLGFERVETLKRERQEWEMKDIKFCVDKFSFGTFLEIEGSKKNIEKTIKLLGFENRERIIKSYLGIKKDK